MNSRLEIRSRFDSPQPANRTLFSGLGQGIRIRENRLYRLDWEGEVEALDAFIHDVLVDEVSETYALDAPPLENGHVIMVDVSLKPSVLDLEREAILECLKKRDFGALQITQWTNCSRHYLFSDVPELNPEPLLRHLVNPAIHDWRLTRA